MTELRFGDASVLVTGAGGLLGNELTRALRAAGAANVLTPSRSELDLADRRSVAAYFQERKPEYLFHLAAQVFGLGGNLSNQLIAISNNTIINDNVFMAAANSGLKKIFFAGTVASYPHPYHSLPLREEALFLGEPHYGEYGYGNAKRHAHAYLKLLHKECGIPFLYGLLTNLYGPRDRFDVANGHVIPSLVRKMHLAKTQHGPLEVWGDGSSSRDFMFAADAADAIVLAFRKTDGLANIATGESHSIRSVVATLAEIAGFKGPVTWQIDKPAGIKDRSVSVSRLAQLGFFPAHSLRNGLSKTYEWYVTNEAAARK